MFNHIFLLLSIIYLSTGEIKKKSEDVEKNRMMGIDTSHEFKIDKDTIITRNMKLEKRRGAKRK